MADEANVTSGANDEAVETQNPAENQEEQQEQEKPDKTYTQEELDKMLQAESDRRVTQALKTFKEKELPGMLDGAKSEAEKLAKMTADQKAEHQKKKADEELAKREADLVKREFEATKRELKAQVIETFAEKNIPTYLCDIVNYADAETCGASLELIEKAFRKAVEDGVNARLKQNPLATASPNEDILRQESLTGVLETPGVDWLNAQSFVVKSLETSGYKPHTRTPGFNTGTIDDHENIYTLAFDRDIQFFVDKADVDETNEALTAGNVTAQFMRSQAVPEVDAYRFSKIATKAVSLSQSASETVTKATIYGRLKAAFLGIWKYGASNMITYMSSEAMDALEQSEDFKRSVSTEKIGVIETRVSSVDGVRLLEVWDDDRFKTEFNFTEGFKPTGASKGINFMVVARPSIIAKVKMSSIYLFPPGSHTEGDGWLYQNRLYHDLFVDEFKKDGIYVSVKA